MRPLDETVMAISNLVYNNKINIEALIEEIKKYCKIMKRQGQALHLKNQ